MEIVDINTIERTLNSSFRYNWSNGNLVTNFGRVKILDVILKTKDLANVIRNKSIIVGVYDFKSWKMR